MVSQRMAASLVSGQDGCFLLISLFAGGLLVVEPVRGDRSNGRVVLI